MAGPYIAPFLAQCLFPDCDMLAFRFQVADPAGTDDPDLLFPGYLGVENVTRVSEGLYEITFSHKYTKYLTVLPAVEGIASVAAGFHARFTSYDPDTGKLRITITNAAVTPVAADPLDDVFVHVFCVMARKTGQLQNKAI